MNNPLAHLEEIAARKATAALTVGQEIIMVTSNPWKDHDGTAHDHTIQYHATVTEVRSDGGFCWEAGAVISEKDRPDTFAARSCPTRGEIAGFGVDYAIDKGRLVL